MKMLERLTLITVVVTVAITCGCKQDINTENAGHSPKFSDADVRRALNIAMMILGSREDDEESWVLNTQISVLKQPFFPGTVGVEGAIVIFDEQDNLVRGITTRTFNRETGSHYEVRDLTSAELAEASKALRTHYYAILSAEDRRSIKTIVVFSESFKTAVCEAILNQGLTRDYYMGASKTDKTAGIYMRQSGVKTLIAEDKVYYSRD